MSANDMLPLHGVRVVDLSKVLAGPWCGQALGELGADVIKVEPVGAGDDTRAWLPKDQGESATFMAVNHNKRSLAVDLKQPEGRAIVHRLVERADIVLQGFGGGTAARLGVDHVTLMKLNPRLIYCEISGYGRSGPLGDAPGYDVMLQAFSGMIHTIGQPDGPYTRVSFSPVDLGTGMNALSGVLAAIIQRDRTGRGLYLEVSLLDTSIGFMTYLAQNYWRSGVPPRRMGTGHPSLCPYQVFEAADQPLMIGVGNDVQWRRFCAVAGFSAEVDDPEFATNAARVRNFARTVALVQARVASDPADWWLERLRAAGVPCSPIHTLPDALSHPQVAARGQIVESEHAVLGTVRQVGLPVKFADSPRAAQRSAPVLGQHTREVLREAGYDDATIAGLLARQVIGDADARLRGARTESTEE